MCRRIRTTLLMMCMATLIVTWLGSPELAAAAKASRPNLIVIMADDLGAKELSCYGSQEHHTPNLDELARTGVRFDTCFATPICHPTRFEIMTGQYGCHNKVYHFAGRRGGPRPDSPEEQIINHATFAHVLKKAGYATAMAGNGRERKGEQRDNATILGFAPPSRVLESRKSL